MGYLTTKLIAWKEEMISPLKQGLNCCWDFYKYLLAQLQVSINIFKKCEMQPNCFVVDLRRESAIVNTVDSNQCKKTKRLCPKQRKFTSCFNSTYSKGEFRTMTMRFNNLKSRFTPSMQSTIMFCFLCSFSAD